MPYPSRFVHVATAFAAGILLTGPAVTAQFAGGGGGNQERPIVAAFDADKNGRLNTAERQAARQALTESVRAGGAGWSAGP